MTISWSTILAVLITLLLFATLPANEPEPPPHNLSQASCIEP